LFSVATSIEISEYENRLVGFLGSAFVTWLHVFHDSFLILYAVKRVNFSRDILQTGPKICGRFLRDLLSFLFVE